jgi:Fe-S cluster assembly iron-binding protein IscA
MLQVTPAATKHLVRVRKERGIAPDAGARFVSNGTGVGLTFAPTPEPGDGVVDGSEIQIFVASQIQDRLSRSQIDVSEKNGKLGLVLRPQARAKKSDA